MASMSTTTGLELAALIVTAGAVSLCAFAVWLAWHKDRGPCQLLRESAGYVRS